MLEHATSVQADLLGTPLTEAERRLLHVYGELKVLAGDDGLPPCAAANARAALSSVAVAVAGLALGYEHLIDQKC